MPRPLALALALAAVLALFPAAAHPLPGTASRGDGSPGTRPSPPLSHETQGPGPSRGAADGRLETEQAHFEILGRPLRAGDRIELPEGYLVVEEDGPESSGVGSFGVVAASSLFAGASGTAPAASGVAGASDPAAASPAAPSCDAERSAYLAELWRTYGIDLSDPAALLDGLEAGQSGPAAGFYWFALQADPFRALAWSSALRARAEALARCARTGASAVAPAGAAPAFAAR